MAKRSLLGDVELSVVEKENPSYSNAITDNPVEQGVNISDHVKPNPITLSINGIIVGDDAAQKLQTLRNYWADATLLTYSGRNVFTNLAIESFGTEHGKEVANGFVFDLSLKQIRIAQSQIVTIANIPQAAKPQTKKGKQTTKSKSVDTQKKQTFVTTKYKNIAESVG